jgi:hypothetical protein
VWSGEPTVVGVVVVIASLGIGGSLPSTMPRRRPLGNGPTVRKDV